MSDPVPVPVLVLAAGAGSRFGSDDKLLAPVAGQAVLAHVLAAVGACVSPTDTYVVVDLSHPARVELVAATGAVVVPSPSAERGMRWSIAAGLAAVPARAGGVAIVLGDDPLAARSLPRVLEHALVAPDTAACIDRGAGAPHPVYLPRAAWPAPPTDHDDSGLRGLLDGAARIADPSSRSHDVDEPGDLDALDAQIRH